MKQGDKYLITTDNWFIAPDGEQYRGVWGRVGILPDSFLGVKTNAKSSNWYVQIGSGDNFMILAGCQVHYAVRCPEKPHTDRIPVEKYFEGDLKTSQRLTDIYIAE